MSRAAVIDAPPPLCECDEPAGDEESCATCNLPIDIPEALQAEVDELARRWSALHDEIEREGWDRQARRESGEDYAPDDDEPGFAAKVEAQRRMRGELQARELEAIEELLAARGARMMRPYEHWNEDERYMEWSERDR